jgi:hypothetical protein
MAVPNLTDEQIGDMIKRVLVTPEAIVAGLEKSPYENPDWLGVCTRVHRDHYHHEGDMITAHNFRLAINHVVQSRGNLGGDREVVKVYWTILRTPPEEWSTRTIITIASFGPRLGADEEIKTWV